MRELRESLRRFIERGIAAAEYALTDAASTAHFFLQGLHGALVPVLHEQNPDRDRFLTPGRELVRKTLAA